MHNNSWKVVLGLVLAVGLVSFWWLGGRQGMDSRTPERPSLDEATPPPTPSAGAGEADTRALAEDQLAANLAAGRQVGVGPVTGPVTERPPFVSLIEWNVLQQVASQHPQPEQELTRLINHLRFAKQWELWKAGELSDAEARQALAEQLLEEIPLRVANRELDPGYAQQMQMSLLKVLVADPIKRRQRAAREAERIGVRFSVENS